MTQKNEISIKQIVQALYMCYVFLLSRWKTIVICGMLGGSIGLTYSILSKRNYHAELTFALEEKTSGTNGLGSIASQFGFDFGRSDNGAFSGDNILELAKSGEIIKRALFTELLLENRKEMLINRYIRYNELDKAWASSENEELKKLRFVNGRDQSLNSVSEDSVIMAIVADVRKQLIFSRVEKKSSIIKAVYSSYDQVFAKHFTEAIVANVSEFYIDTKTKKMKHNIYLLENRLDSIKGALDNEMYEAASNQDANQNTTRMKVRLPYAKRQMNIQILTTLYGELIKNLELAKMSLMREEPLIQIIDTPRFPIQFTRPRKIVSAFAGALAAGLFCCVFLLVRKLYKDENLNI